MTSLIDVAVTLNTDKKCLDYIEALRWPGGVACLKCGSLRVARTISTVKARRDKKDGTKAGDVVKLRFVYDCLERQWCGHQFTATTGTIFHDSHLPLPKWFLAIALFVDAKKSLSALQLQRHLKIGSYKTAWYLAHRIRKAMEQPEGPFGGTVEVDETYVGGKFDIRRKRQKYGKQGVVGVVQRGEGDEPSKVRVRKIVDKSGSVLVGFVRDNVSMDAEMVCTDSNPSYFKLGRAGYTHEVVNHIKGEYARGQAHTNNVENFWSLFKRALVGQHHSVSVKHLTRYLDEAAYKFNNRRDSEIFTSTVERMVNTDAMPYEDLTASE
jgi:hypothetical protein